MQDQIKDIDRLMDIKEFCSFVLRHRPETEEAFSSNEVFKMGAFKRIGKHRRSYQQGYKSHKVGVWSTGVEKDD